jgi:hypothetical protein
MAPLPGRSEPLFLTRLGHEEHKFIEHCDGDTDGVVINLRFDAATGRGRLKRTAIEKRLPFVIDIETWRLPFLNGPEDEAFRGDIETPVGAATPLPLRPEELKDAAVLAKLVRAAAQVQAGALYCFAPYFLVSSLKDPWLEINLHALAELRRIAPRQPLAAWVYVGFEAMMEGLVPHLAERYGRELPTGSTVVLTVSDIRNEDRSPEEIATYLRGIESFAENGLHVIADRASEIAITAVVSGAVGCMLGNRLYRTAPSDPRWRSPYNPRIKLRYFDGERVRRVRRDLAKARGKRGKLGCRYAPKDCDAINADDDHKFEVALHASHEMRDAVRRADRVGAAVLRREWGSAPQKPLRVFAQALALAEARSEEA